MIDSGYGLPVPGAWLLPGLVVGHAALALASLSRAHAVGLGAKWMTRLAAAPLAVPALVAVGLGWLVLARPVADWPGVALGYAWLCNVAAWVVVPIATVARRLRPAPRGVTQRVDPLLLAGSERRAEFIGQGKYHWMLGLAWNESLSLQARSFEIALPVPMRAAAPLRVLHLSDLHFARCYDRSYFEAVAEAASQWESDLVLFTGDLVDDEATLDWVGPVLGRLRGRLGQFAILGNHDFSHRPGRVRRALRGAGFAMLDGRWTAIADGRRTIALGGTSAPWGPQLDPEGRPEADLMIVLSHSPDQFPRVASWGSVDLVLAGHNHGGQVRLPLIGPIVMPSLHGLRYDRGVFRRGRTLMEVTQGIGGKHPLRYGCPPEFVRLTLRPAHAGASPFAGPVRRASDSSSRR